MKNYKVEGNIIYPDKTMLTWGPFYFHSLDLAQKKMDEILNWIIDWVNEKDKTLNIKPENLIRNTYNSIIGFEINAWKDETHLEKCTGIITVDDIFFEDE